MMKRNKVNIGLIGLGGQGKKIADAILKTTNVRLVACYHSQRERAEKCAERYKCQPFNDLVEMLKEEKIEGVVIATPNHLHYQHMKICLKYKKHIFVEKPITNKLKEAREIIKEANDKNITLMVGHNLRRNDAVRKMRELINNSKIGKFVSAEMNLSHAGGMRFSKDEWRFYRDRCPGGPLMMLGIHLADISNYLFGEANSVVSRIMKLYTCTETEDTSLLLVELKSGGIVYICSNYNVPATYFIRIYGTRGILEFNRNSGHLTFQGLDIDRKLPPLEYITYNRNDTLLEEMEEFGDCILYNKKPETGGKEAFQALAIIEAAMSSNKKKKFIDIKYS